MRYCPRSRPPTLRRWRRALSLGALLANLTFGLWLAPPLIGAARAGELNRHDMWVKKFAKGPKATLARATFFGGKGHEEFSGVVVLPDQRVAVYGNTWGPPFPDNPKPRVLGLDSPWDVPLNPPGLEFDKRNRPRPPEANNPNRTGFIAIYSPDLSKLESVTRFGFGLASITAARQMSDKSFVISGLCTNNFRSIAKKAKQHHIEPRPADNPRYGPYEYAGETFPGDSYVAKLSPDLSTIEWVWIFEGFRKPPSRIVEGKDGLVIAALMGSKRIYFVTADGSKATPFEWKDRKNLKLGRSLQFEFLGANPVDSTLLFGGDHQSGTGQEPWRKPICVGVTPEGYMAWRVYDFDGPLVGTSHYRLVSDSSCRVANFNDEGQLAMYIWSDGGNSIATRNPIDLDRPTDSKGIGMSVWGAGVGSYAHLVRFDPNTCDKVFYSFWASYLPGGSGRTPSKPNSITVDNMLALKTGETAVTGGSASYLVQTPMNWYKLEDCPFGGRGPYVTLFNKSFTNALFSSALPEAEPTGMADNENGFIVVSSVKAPADQHGNEMPAKEALQDAFGGGKLDGHIFLMTLPQPKTEGSE